MRSLALVLAGILVTAAACASDVPPPVTAPRPDRRPVVESFTEPSSVTALATVGGWLFVGTTAALERWDLQTGERVRLGEGVGVPPGPVTALVADAGRVWVATTGGLARYDIGAGRARRIRAPRRIAAASSVRALAPDGRGGVWVGGAAGLFRVAAAGNWRRVRIRGEVLALHRSAAGDLWIATPGEVLRRTPSGRTRRWGDADGMLVQTARALVEIGGGVPAVVGEDAAGRSRVAFLRHGAFATYRLVPEAPILAAARRGAHLLLATPARVLAVGPGIDRSPRLTRDGVHLVGVTGKRRSPYHVAIVERRVPPGVTALAAGADLFLGTRALGTQRLSDGRPPTARWLRPRELTTAAQDLYVACRTPDECYVATGGKLAWRFDGAAFTPLVPDGEGAIVLAVVGRPGEVYALHREPGERALHVSVLERGIFFPRPTLDVEMPQGTAMLSFAGISPRGMLWLGLEYVDEDNYIRPHGVAVLDVTMGLTAVHVDRRAAQAHDAGASVEASDAGDGVSGVLPIPDGVLDVAFHRDDIWLAVRDGALRVRSGEPRVFDKLGPRSAIRHGLVVTPGGGVALAVQDGVRLLGADGWTTPRPLATTVHAIAGAPDGRIWIATARGLVAWDGRRAARFDRRTGLLDEKVENVVVDALGRTWARTTQGLTVVTP